MSDRVERFKVTVGVEFAGKRLDQALAVLFPDFSRSRLQQWVKAGLVTIDGHPCKQRDKVAGGEEVRLEARLEDQVECRPQAIPLNLIYEDRDILVVDKPAGLVVHPAAGNPDGTLQNGLLGFDPDMIRLPRAGIVHRLDKDTSGLLVVARTTGAHRSLVEQLQAREIKREYRAVAVGVLTAGGRIDQPIGRHPVHRTKMAVVPSGKPAVTHFRVLERFRAHSYLRVNLETGRTHQIRVHLAHVRAPLVGDPLYGGRLRMPADISSELADTLRGFGRQALHAHRLGLRHPVNGDWLEWVSQVPEDMQHLLDVLRLDMNHG